MGKFQSLFCYENRTEATGLIQYLERIFTGLETELAFELAQTLLSCQNFQENSCLSEFLLN